MNKNLLLSTFLILGFISCSSNDSMEEGNSDVTVENEESVLQENEHVDESASVSPMNEEVLMESESSAPSVTLDESAESELEGLKSNTMGIDSNNSYVSESIDHPEMTSDNAQFAYYQVQKGDSLMLVSFKVYGDYRKWKKIYHLNETELKNSTSLSSGMNLKYEVPEEKFTWNPEGSPYLIKSDDTLGKISANVYQKPIYWKYIYDNNRTLIRNPNLIFAGFTLYYKELTQEVIDNSRSLSSKKR